MANLLKFEAKKCWTAAGVLIHEGKVLLIKHKKVGIWLNPGGHCEPGEAPHQAAEREFWEEAGIKVKAIDFGFTPDQKDTEYVPNPFATNLHWVCRDNYEHRVHGAELTKYAQTHWKKGCEQHLNFLYLLKPVGDVKFKENIEETDGIGWFTLAELDTLETHPQIRQEVAEAMRLSQLM
ncbi:MAG TPA: NUDIX domain-containing protein [Vitreimonas sp.]|nr:NUDIX domain-containing protein [Vitreimonas sp.]